MTFAPGATRASAQVDLIRDVEVEGDEQFFVQLLNPTNATIADDRATVTLLDDDTDPPSARVGNAIIGEGDAGETLATFGVSLDSISRSDRTVTVATDRRESAIHPAATPGSDDAPATIVVRIPAGTLTKPVQIAVKGDTADEPDEVFLVDIVYEYSDVAYSINQPGQGMIVDDDPQPKEVPVRMTTPVDEAVHAYIEAIGPAQRPLFDRIHRLIAAAYPGVTLVMSYKMPTFDVDGRRLHVGVWKHGVSFYGWAEERDGGFTARHPELSSGKGTIRLRPVDADAIGDDELLDVIRAALDA